MKQAISKAVKRLGILRYFPIDPYAQAEVAKLLERMVDTPVHLEWLVTAMIDEVGEWRGPTELRGVYCSHYRPADGKEANCEHGPFSTAALEQRSIEQADKVRQIEERSAPAIVKRLVAAKAMDAVTQRSCTTAKRPRFDVGASCKPSVDNMAVKP